MTKPKTLFHPGCKVWLNGPRGSGKTLTARLIAHQVASALRAEGQQPLVQEVDEDESYGPGEVVAYGDIVILNLFGRLDTPPRKLVTLMRSARTVLVTQQGVATDEVRDAFPDTIFGIAHYRWGFIEVMFEGRLATMQGWPAVKQGVWVRFIALDAALSLAEDDQSHS